MQEETITRSYIISTIYDIVKKIGTTKFYVLEEELENLKGIVTDAIIDGKYDNNEKAEQIKSIIDDCIRHIKDAHDKAYVYDSLHEIYVLARDANL